MIQFRRRLLDVADELMAFEVCIICTVDVNNPCMVHRQTSIDLDNKRTNALVQNDELATITYRRIERSSPDW